MSDSTRKWQREYMRKWRAKNRSLDRARNRAAAKLYRERHPMKLKDRKKAEHLKRNYGLTLDSFAALLRGQGDVCAICKAEGEDWVVDHEHASGKVRGVLCRLCNVGLGYFKDDPSRLLSAAKYLTVK